MGYRILYSLLFVSLSASALTPKNLTPYWNERIRDAAQRAGVAPALVRAVMQVESNFNPSAVSEKGAMGLMQMMKRTARFCGVQAPFHPIDNMMQACVCLKSLILRYRGNLELALSAYNAGTPIVDKLKRIPKIPETESYVKKVLALYRQLESNPR